MGCAKIFCHFTTNVICEESEDGYMVIYTGLLGDIHIIGWVYAPEANEESESAEPVFMFNDAVRYYSN